ncbi:MAG TPA: hypothetical protein DCQ83_09290 [Fibrobacteres bacterium]|jgi:hypothetical protein|nr:hypothetical protein [Fibrobacterota bacterium]
MAVVLLSCASPYYLSSSDQSYSPALSQSPRLPQIQVYVKYERDPDFILKDGTVKVWVPDTATISDKKLKYAIKDGLEKRDIKTSDSGMDYVLEFYQWTDRGSYASVEYFPEFHSGSGYGNAWGQQSDYGTGYGNTLGQPITNWSWRNDVISNIQLSYHESKEIEKPMSVTNFYSYKKIVFTLYSMDGINNYLKGQTKTVQPVWKGLCSANEEDFDVRESVVITACLSQFFKDVKGNFSESYTPNMPVLVPSWSKP